MNKTAIMYNDTQFEEIQDFVGDNFGSHYDYVVHEITSEYVHTDTFLLKSEQGDKIFVTCGMGARAMNTPNNFKRCELVMMADKKFVSTSQQGIVLAGELVAKSKFPFREDTWLGTGHTIDASKNFKETFGFDYFAFVKPPISTNLSGIDEKINFLLAVPIYEAEREWCVQNHTLAFLERLHEKYNGRELFVNFKRDVFIPDDLDEEELFGYNVMTTFGMDRSTFDRFYEFLSEQEQSGEENSEMIIKWIEENV